MILNRIGANSRPGHSQTITPGSSVTHSIADHANGARIPPLARCTLRMGMHMNLLVHVQANGRSAAGAWHVAAANRRHGPGRSQGARPAGMASGAPAHWGIMVAGPGRRI